MRWCQSDWILFRFLIPWYIIAIFLLATFKETIARKKVLIYVPRKTRQVHHHHHHQPLVVLMDSRLPPAPQHYRPHPHPHSPFRQKLEVGAAPVIHHHHGPIISPVALYKASKGEYHHTTHTDTYDSQEHQLTGPAAEYGYGDHSASVAYPRLVHIPAGLAPSGGGPTGHRTRVRSRLVYL